MSKAKILIWACLFLFTVGVIDISLISSPVQAQYDDSTSSTLETVDIRGTIRREELQSTTATVLENKDLVDKPFYMPVEMLKKVPGVYLAFYGESGIGAEIRVRGFTGGHGGGDIGMYMDGIPIHDNGHGTGYIDTSMLMPIEIESVEVIKGPASVYYGQHGAGASIPFQSIKGGNLNRLNLRYGSHNDIDITGLLARESGKFAQVYAFELYHGDGYRDNSTWDRKNFSGRWTYNFNDSLRISLNLRAFQAEWDSAGYIYRFKHADNIFAAADDGSGEGNGGDRQRYDARLWVEYLLNNNSQLTFYLYGTDLKNRRIMKSERNEDPAILFATGTDAFNHHKSFGTGLTYSFRGDLWQKPATAALGISYSYEKEDPRESWPLSWGSGRAHRTPLSNSLNKMSLVNPAIFGEITYQVLDQLNIRLGGRYEALSGTINTIRTTSATTPLGRSDSPTYTFFSPKIGLLFTPLDWVQVYANFGRGFSAPGLNAGATGFYAGNAFDLSVRDQFELGTRLALTDWLDFEFALFRLDTKNDSSYDPITDTNMPIGVTRRQGIETSIDMRPFKDWYFNANYTFIDSRYRHYLTTNQDRAGYMIPSTMPRHTTNLELAYAPPEGFGIRANFHWEAYFYIRDEPGTLRSGAPNTNIPYLRVKDQDNGTLDMQLSYTFNKNYRLAFDVLNVLDKQYFGTAYTGYATWNGVSDYYITPRPPRTFFLTMQMNWDAE